MKKRKIIITISIFLIVSLSVLLSYSFFTTISQNKNQELTGETGTLNIIFADENSGITEALEFGSSIEKTFTIENTGTLNTYVKINWDRLINTYIEDSLTYTLSYAETLDGNYTEIITNENVPTSTSETTFDLANGIFAPANSKYYYKLTITLNYLTDKDQTADLNAIFITNFKIEETDNSIVVSFDTQGGQIDTDDKKVTINSEYGELPLPTKTGYAFLGWYTSPNDGELINASSIVNKHINQTLYAHWIKAGIDATKEKLNLSVKSGRPNFSVTATTDEGVYAQSDAYGTSYYYRGAVTNNYVKFAGFYWKIIRVNGNGSLRIIFDGTKAWNNGYGSVDRVAIVSTPYNLYSKDAKYVGYMFGPLGTANSSSASQARENLEDSNIKIKLESWYKTNIFDKNLDKYVSDELFCNDRETYSGSCYGENRCWFKPEYRIYTTQSPTFYCSSKNDAFTKNDLVKGNGKLNQKVGLITVDEVATAGGVHSEANNNFYLYKGRSYWTMSPDYNSPAMVWLVNADGSINLVCGGRDCYTSSSTPSISPVINLSVETVPSLIGTGTSTDPYRLPGDKI